MNLQQLLNIIEEQKDENLHNKIINFIRSYEDEGMNGLCGKFAIQLNHYLNNIGVYYAVINPIIWERGDNWLGHVALKVHDKLYDITGPINNEIFSSFGRVEVGSDEQDLYNLTDDECYETEIVDLSNIWGEQVEEKILENTSCDI